MRLTRPRETEASFMRAVCELAALGGWRVFHAWLSVRSHPGWPDLVLTKPGQPVIYAELKLDGKQPTPAQAAWLEALQSAIGTEVYCWRPSDWSKIVDRLMPQQHPS